MSSPCLPQISRTLSSFFPGPYPPLCGLLASNFERVSLRPLSVTFAFDAAEEPAEQQSQHALSHRHFSLLLSEGLLQLPYLDCSSR